MLNQSLGMGEEGANLFSSVATASETEERLEQLLAKLQQGDLSDKERNDLERLSRNLHWGLI